MKPPKWTASQRAERTVNQAARCIAIREIEQLGLLNLSNKSETARRLNVSRFTLDRDLMVIEQANSLIQQYVKLLLDEE